MKFPQSDRHYLNNKAASHGCQRLVDLSDVRTVVWIHQASHCCLADVQATGQFHFGYLLFFHSGVEGQLGGNHSWHSY